MDMFGFANLKIDKLLDKNKYIFLIDSKKNNYNSYIIEVTEIVNNIPNRNYPLYYNEIDMKKDLWFKVKKDKENR